jgi:hypothetical protein
MEQPNSMEQPSSKRLVLTSVNQLITLVRQNPQLTASVPRLNLIGRQTLAEAPKKSCNCGSKRNVQTDAPAKQAAEQVLSALTVMEFKTIKNVLRVDQLCYYKRNLTDNSLELICI